MEDRELAAGVGRIHDSAFPAVLSAAIISEAAAMSTHSAAERRDGAREDDFVTCWHRGIQAYEAHALLQKLFSGMVSDCRSRA
jgi:hypothetical protein